MIKNNRKKMLIAAIGVLLLWTRFYKRKVYYKIPYESRYKQD